MGLRSRQRRWACALQDRSSMSYGVTPQLRAPLQKRGRWASPLSAAKLAGANSKLPALTSFINLSAREAANNLNSGKEAANNLNSGKDVSPSSFGPRGARS